MEDKIPVNTLAYAMAFVCVFCISLGQILFKLVASGDDQLIDKLFTARFILAMVVYFGATLLWLWVLRHLPLTTAYPIIALAFVIVPVMSIYALDESIGIKEIIGGITIIVGVVTMSWGKLT